MDNAVDALKMAAAVLVFVLALSICINAFGQVRKTAQIIIENTDREFDYTYVEENGSTERIVGAETIVPSIYRAYKENYKIVFRDKSGNGMELYKKTSDTGTQVIISSIDLEKETLGNDNDKEKFIRALLYGENSAYVRRYRLF